VPWGLRVQQTALSKHNAFPYLHFMITTTSQTACVINFYVNLNAGLYSLSGSWDNVVSKVTRLWPRQSRLQILEEARYFSLVQNFQTDSGNQPASYSISKGLFSKHKAGLV
jgi:hypothetical protein